MSMTSPPMSLSQFKVSQLRDELRKRGLSVKGIKRDLIERLEEAIRKKEQEDVSLPVVVLPTSFNFAGLEDLKGEDSSIMNLSQEDAPMGNSLPVNRKSVLSSPSRALSGVSASSAAPGFIGPFEGSEPGDADIGANVETNDSDVMFVDNAEAGVCDGVILPKIETGAIDRLPLESMTGTMIAVMNLSHPDIEKHGTITEASYGNGFIASEPTASLSEALLGMESSVHHPLHLSEVGDGMAETQKGSDKSGGDQMDVFTSSEDVADIKADSDLASVDAEVLEPRSDWSLPTRDPEVAWSKEDEHGKANNCPAMEDVKNYASLKREQGDEMEPKVQEPTKRVRRWNYGKEGAAVDAPKSLESCRSGNKGMIACVFGSTSRSSPPGSNINPKLNGNKRIVPTSRRSPSKSLKVERFIRPFTLKAVKDMLAEFGECVDFWMDDIKTHCYVTYSSVDEAAWARKELYGRQWPPSVGNYLRAHFVDAEEVRIRSRGLVDKEAAFSSSPAFSSFQFAAASHGQVRPQPQPSMPTLETGGPRLDDLFKKTRVKPHIYFLPLIGEQVMEKAAKN